MPEKIPERNTTAAAIPIAIQAFISNPPFIFSKDSLSIFFNKSLLPNKIKNIK